MIHSHPRFFARCFERCQFSMMLVFNVTMRKHMRFNIILGSKTTSIIIRSTEVQIIGIWQVDWIACYRVIVVVIAIFLKL